MNSASQGKLNDFGKNLVLGFQHLLAMYSGDVLVPLLIGNFLHFNAAQMTYLVSIDIFMCGIATLLQLRKTPLTGIGLPVVLGCAVQSVAPFGIDWRQTGHCLHVWCHHLCRNLCLFDCRPVC